MRPKELTRMEKRVLAQLDRNARAPFRRMGRGIRKSEQSVSYTVNSLLKRGIIRNFHALVDYSRLSALNFRVLFRIGYKSERSLKRMISSLAKDPHTLWVASCGGRHDLICTFAACNPSQFNKHLRGIMARFPRQLHDYNILTTIVIRMLEREYLDTPRARHREIVLGGDREPIGLADRDMQILAGISDNARENAVAIASRLSCSARTVVNRIKALEDLQVIRGYRPFIDFSMIGHVANLLMVKYHNISVEDEERLIGYLSHHQNVTSITKILGLWDLEIMIEAETRSELRKIEWEVRQKFAGLIYMTEAVPIYKEYKKTFFPRFVLERPEPPGPISSSPGARR